MFGVDSGVHVEALYIIEISIERLDQFAASMLHARPDLPTSESMVKGYCAFQYFGVHLRRKKSTFSVTFTYIFLSTM